MRALVACLLLLQAAPLIACTCGPVPLKRHFQSSSAFFVGRVVAGETIADLEILESFKGPKKGVLRVDGSGMCGYAFKAGETYLVSTHGPEYKVSYCGPNAPIDSDAGRERLRTVRRWAWWWRLWRW